MEWDGRWLEWGNVHISMSCLPMLIVPLSSSREFMPKIVAKKESGS